MEHNYKRWGLFLLVMLLSAFSAGAQKGGLKLSLKVKPTKTGLFFTNGDKEYRGDTTLLFSPASEYDTLFFSNRDWHYGDHIGYKPSENAQYVNDSIFIDIESRTLYNCSYKAKGHYSGCCGRFSFDLRADSVRHAEVSVTVKSSPLDSATVTATPSDPRYGRVTGLQRPYLFQYEKARLLATPKSGCGFRGWRKGNGKIFSTDTAIVVTMERAALNYVAVFDTMYKVSVEAGPKNDGAIMQGKTKSFSYAHYIYTDWTPFKNGTAFLRGDSVRLRATSSRPNWHAVRWVMDDSVVVSTAEEYTLVLTNADVNLKAFYDTCGTGHRVTFKGDAEILSQLDILSYAGDRLSKGYDRYDIKLTSDTTIIFCQDAWIFTTLDAKKTGDYRLNVLLNGKKERHVWENDSTVEYRADTLEIDRDLTFEFVKETSRLRIPVRSANEKLGSVSGSGTYFLNDNVGISAQPINGKGTFRHWLKGDSIISKERSLHIYADWSDTIGYTAVFDTAFKVTAKTQPEGFADIHTYPNYPAVGDTVRIMHNGEENSLIFSHYEVDGVAIEGNSFVMPKHDVEVVGFFEECKNHSIVEIRCPSRITTVTYRGWSESDTTLNIFGRTGQDTTLNFCGNDLRLSVYGEPYDIKWKVNGVVSDSLNHYGIALRPGKKYVVEPDLGQDTIRIIANVEPAGAGDIDQRYYGDTIRICSEPAANYEFRHWVVNDSIYSDVPCLKFGSASVSEDLDITAVFRIMKVSVTTTVEPANAGTVVNYSGDSVYTRFDTLRLCAEPAENYLFDHWEINDDGFSHSQCLGWTRTDEDLHVKAVFLPLVSSVGSIDTKTYAAIGEKGSLLVTATPGERVKVANLYGQQILSKRIEATEERIALPAGFYIVRIGGETFKVIVY